MSDHSRSILIVDDDDAFRERLAVSFRRRGYLVAVAADTDQALAALVNHSIDAAVIDLKLARENGLSLIPHLRRRYPALKTIILTGYGSIASAVEAIRLGAVDYLTKPADAEQIESALFGAQPEHSETGSAQIPSLDKVAWEHLHRVLQDCDGNISKAARTLGIERRSLQRKLQKYPPHR